MATILEAQDLSLEMGGETIFEPLSFTVDEGQWVSLVGPSGSGKTSLLRVLAGLQKGRGELRYSGGDGPLYHLQQSALLPWLTLEQNVALPLALVSRPQRLPRNVQLQRARVTLDRLGLGAFGRYYPEQLSGGMAQRGSLARTLMTESPVLLLDEPFSALDWFTRRDIRQWMTDHEEFRSKTVLLVTHDVEEALLLGQRVLLMAGVPGRLVGQTALDAPWPRREGQLEQGVLERGVKAVMDKLFPGQL